MAEVYCGSPRKQVVLKPCVCLDLGGEGERSEACGKTGPTRNECRRTGCVGNKPFLAVAGLDGRRRVLCGRTQ